MPLHAAFAALAGGTIEPAEGFVRPTIGSVAIAEEIGNDLPWVSLIKQTIPAPPCRNLARHGRRCVLPLDADASPTPHWL